MKKLFIAILAGALNQGTAFGHGDHSMPGSLPPPPNGGKIAEAKHEGQDEHQHKEGEPEAELFVEVKDMKTEFKIYALELVEGAKVFKKVAPSESLSVTDFQLELTRSKKTEKLSAKANGDHWAVSLPVFKDKRVFAHVTVKSGNETKKAKIQIER